MPIKKCLIFSGPSGSGKSTLIKFVLRTFRSACATVSCTTRLRRDSEVDGLDYHFISHSEFDELVASGEFLEHTECYGNRYGTLRSAVYDVLADHDLCIIDLDYNGAHRVLAHNIIPEYECVGILVLPPSLGALESRLHFRNSETPESIKRRIDESFNVPKIAGYQHVIINDDADAAFGDITSIITSIMQQ
ncbi:MAG: guanylate kinase [Holosporales bacterium]|jgi:guanylate kinase|nr:guanylate kinase [Holosporales bacterium]